MAEKVVSIQVFGKVQYVGFRYHTRATALRYGIKGYVQNQIDGSVYIEAEGESMALDLFCAWCRKGPDWARVNRINICNLSPQGFTVFEIK